MTDRTSESKPLPFTLVAGLITLIVVLALGLNYGVVTVRTCVDAGAQSLMAGIVTLAGRAVSR